MRGFSKQRLANVPNLPSFWQSGGGPALPVNIVAPSIDANGYPGGSYTFSEGIWTGFPALTMTLESSVDGVSGWTDQGAVLTTGTWAAGLAGLYVRLKVVPNAGATAYSVPFGPLGLAYNQVLDFAGNGNRLTHAVTAPFIGADLAAATSGASAPGFWLQALWYYDGVGLEGGAGIVALGNAGGTLDQASLNTAGVLWRNGGAGAWPEAIAPAAAGWYLNTAYFYNSGGNHHAQMQINASTATASGSGAVSLTNFTSLWIGDAVSSAPDTDSNYDEKTAYVAFGRGNPSAAHAWAYNGGKIRRVDDYGFAADAAATIEGFIPLYRENPGNTVFSVGAVADTIGSFDSWSLTGSLAYENRVPGFINPAGDPPTTPARYIYPRYATTADTTLTLCTSTKAVGTAVAGDFTVTSLTHSVAGNIAGTVTGTTLPNPGAGTITGVINGVTVGVEIITPLAMPTDPQFRTLYHGNARAAGIEPYTSPGAGTTYANVAALKAGIDALGSGATLKIADLTDAATLTLTAKNYGGATITCTNRHGVKLGGLVMTGVSGLTIRGIDVATSGGSFVGDSGVDGVILDHCTGVSVTAFGNTGATETFKLSNWIGPDNGTAQQLTFVKFNRLTLHRFAHGNTAASASDVLRTDQCNGVFADRFFLGELGGTAIDAHLDCWQAYLGGTSGTLGGLVMSGVMIDKQEAGEVAAQGGFWNDLSAAHLRVINVAAYSSLSNSLIISSLTGGGFENCTASGAIATGAGSASTSFYAKDNVRGGMTPVLTSAGFGTETGTVNATDMTTLYPAFVSQSGNWQMWEGPTGAAIGKGAHALIAELVASRASAP